MRASTRSPCMAAVGDAGRDEEVAVEAGRGDVGDDEAVAVAVHVEAADGVLLGLAGEDVLAAAEFDDFAAGGRGGRGRRRSAGDRRRGRRVRG